MAGSTPSLATFSQSQGKTRLLNSRTADFSTAVLMDAFSDSKAGRFYVVIDFVISSHQEGLEANHAFPALILWLWRWTLVLPGPFPSAPGLADVLSGCTFTWQVFPSSIKECRAHGTPWGSALTESLRSVFQGSHSSLAEQISEGDPILGLIVPEGVVMNVPIIVRSSPPPALPHESWKP